MADAGYLPDRDAIRADLEHMTHRWHELGRPCKFEVRAFAENEQPQWAQFATSRMDDAVAWAAQQNADGRNLYVVRNPIRLDSRGSAKDEDIIAAFFCWADCDDPASTDNVRRFDGPKWTAAVTTGRTPSTRVHLYWQLEEPVINLTAWRGMQEAIAAHFGSDRTVVNASRIMRLGGTISHPFSKKRAKGYISEACTIRTEYDDEREPVAFERLMRVFGEPRSTPESGISIDTGPTPLDRERARIQALSGEAWHDAMVRLVASYVSRGLSDEEIHALTDALTLAGYTVDQTRREVQTAIDGARRKGWTPDRQPPPELPKVEPGSLFTSWAEVNPLSIPPRDFLYGNHYVRKFASVTVAPGGIGKSTLVLAECVAMATGRPILGVHPKQRYRVVYHNAEDPLEEVQRRVLALCAHHGIDQRALVGQLYISSGRDADLLLAAGESGDIVEGAFAMIEGFHAQHQADLYAFDPLANMTDSPETNDVFRRLGKRVSRLADDLNVSIEIVHHTRKLNGREAEIEDSRGGGALIGAVRAGRVLNPMTADEAAKAGLETHIDHFRIEAAGKSNLARPLDKSAWLRKVSIDLPNGDAVASVEAWRWPDAFDGVSADDALRVQRAILACKEPPKASVQARGWAGNVVAEALGMDAENKTERARIASMIKTWVATDVLRMDHVFSTRDGRDVPVIVAGENNPTGVS